MPHTPSRWAMTGEQRLEGGQLRAAQESSRRVSKLFPLRASLHCVLPLSAPQASCMASCMLQDPRRCPGVACYLLGSPSL